MKKYFSMALAVIMIVLSCGLTAMAASKKIVISCIGDSITNNPNNENYNYPKHLQTKLGAEYEVKNFGRSGAAVKSYTTTNEYANSLKSNPDIVIIMIGTNDSASWVSKETYYNDYISLVNAYASLSSKPAIYLMSSPKAFESANWGDTFKNDIIEGDIRNTVKQIAEEKNLKFIDMYSATQNYSQYFYDGIHPDENGASLIAGTVSPVIIANKPDNDEKNDTDVDIPELDPSEEITVAINYEPMNNTYTVAGGFGQETRGNIPVGLRVYDEAGSYEWVGTTTAKRNEEGKVVFVFEPVAFEESAASGVYSFEITSFLTEPIYVDKAYLTNSDKLSLMKEFDALSGKEYENKLITEGETLGADISLFNALSPTGKNRVVANLSAIKSGLANVTENDSDFVQKVNYAVNAFLNNYNKFVAIEEFNECENASEVSKWIIKYANKFGLTNDRAEVWNYYNNADVKNSTDNFLAALDNMTSISSDTYSATDIKSRIVETIICAEFHHSRISSIDALLSLHCTDLGIDLAPYNRLTDKSVVKSGMYGTGKYTYAELKSVYDGLIAKANSSTQGGNSGNSSGGSSGGGSPVSGIATVVSGKPGNSVNPFADVSDNHWAKKYIVDLFEKKIMNGKTNNSFEPDEKITRAEIVKVIVAAFGLNGKSSKKFNDIPDDAWYADYVATAVYCGIVQGDENSNFRPNNNITRQDLAVMIYRALNVNVNAPEADFSDYDTISDYARKAVNYLAANGVISGYTDGSFAPYGNTTRAEAAKIISSILD